MENTWWGLKEVSCPKCEMDMVQKETYFCADGQIRFRYFCPECEMFIPVDYFASHLQAIALKLDLEKWLENPQPICEPRQASSSFVEQFTEEDSKLERRMGIDPQEEG